MAAVLTDELWLGDHLDGTEGGGRASIQSGFGLWLAEGSSGVDNELERWLVRLDGGGDRGEGDRGGS